MAEIEVTCECGFVSRGSEEEVIAETQAHGRDVHSMDVSHETVLAMARPAGASS